MIRVGSIKGLYKKESRGGTYYYFRRTETRYLDNRKHQVESVTPLGPNLEQAIQKAKSIKRREEAVRRGELLVANLTLGEYAAKYLREYETERRLLAIGTVRSNLNGFVAYAKPETLLDQIDRMKVESFLALRGQEVKPITVRGVFRDVRAMFNRAVLEKVLDASPVAGMRVAKPSPEEPKLPTDEEWVSLMDYLARHNRLLFEILTTLYFTGGRLGEVLSVTYDRIDFARETITLPRRKVKDEFVQEMAPDLHKVLFERWTAQGTPKQGVLFEMDGKPIPGWKVFNMLRPVRRALNMPWFCLATVRKLSGTIVADTHGVWAAQQHLGHSDVRTTLGYLGRRKDQRAKAVRALQERLRGVSGTKTGTRIPEQVERGEKNL